MKVLKGERERDSCMVGLTMIQNLHLPNTRLKIVRSNFLSGSRSSAANLAIANSFSRYVIHHDFAFEVIGLGMKTIPKTRRGNEMTKSRGKIVSNNVSNKLEGIAQYR